MKKKQIIRRLFSYAVPHRYRLIAGIAFALFASLLNLAVVSALIPVFNLLGDTTEPRLFYIEESERKELEHYQKGEDLKIEESLRLPLTAIRIWTDQKTFGWSLIKIMATLCLLILALYALKIAFTFLSLFFFGTVGLLAVSELRYELYSKLSRLEMYHFSRERTGSIMSRVINDPEAIGKYLSFDFNQAVISFFYIITHLAMLFLLSWQMTLITLILAPVWTIIVGYVTKKIRNISMKQRVNLADMIAHAQELISGIRVIRVFSMEKLEHKNFRFINEKLCNNTYRQHYYHQIGPAINELISITVILGMILWSISRVIEGDMSSGIFFAFIGTLTFIVRSAKQVSVTFNLLGASSAAAERAFEILDLPINTVSIVNARPFHSFRDSIRYENVSFRYPTAERPILHNISIEIPCGSKVSFVGPSGAGKSTLLDLLLRLYDPTSGAILIDGQDIRNFDLQSLRSSIGVVSQEVFLFHTTLRENIAYGRPDTPLAKIETAAQAANAHEFIERLPQAYDTVIGERGVMLSGGEQQRIAIARTLLFDPPILIFDEATSNLDNKSEYLIQQAIERLSAGRTILSIAHRLSTIYRSDKIIVQDGGRIAAQGKHDQLLENNELYRRLYEMQFSMDSANNRSEAISS